MKLIPILSIGDVVLASSNVPENDFVLYGAATTYARGNRVRTTDHRVFQSAVDNNTGNDPLNPANVVSVDNPSAPWIYVSYTNRWRAFDGRNSAKTRQSGSITYDIDVGRTSDVTAFMGLEATTVRVQIINPDSSVAYDRTRELVDTSSIVDWFSYYTWEADSFDTQTIFYGIPAYPGTTLRLTIDAGGGEAAVAIIGFGRRKEIGKTLLGTQPSIIDYSTRERDIFGNDVIVERAFAKVVNFNVAFPTKAYSSIARVLEPLRATPAIYYEDEELTHDLMVLGFYTDFAPALGANYTLTTIEITGVT